MPWNAFHWKPICIQMYACPPNKTRCFNYLCLLVLCLSFPLYTSSKTSAYTLSGGMKAAWLFKASGQFLVTLGSFWRACWALIWAQHWRKWRRIRWVTLQSLENTTPRFFWSTRTSMKIPIKIINTVIYWSMRHSNEHKPHFISGICIFWIDKFMETHRRIKTPYSQPQFLIVK